MDLGYFSCLQGFKTQNGTSPTSIKVTAYTLYLPIKVQCVPHHHHYATKFFIRQLRKFPGAYTWGILCRAAPPHVFSPHMDRQWHTRESIHMVPCILAKYGKSYIQLLPHMQFLGGGKQVHDKEKQKLLVNMINQSQKNKHTS
jgi:hypothetical protein